MAGAQHKRRVRTKPLTKALPKYGNAGINGMRLLHETDGRSVFRRRHKVLVRQFTADLGGQDACSTAELTLIERLAVITIEMERRETEFALAGHIPDDQFALHLTASNAMRRLCESIGLRRRPRDATLTLDQYLQSKYPGTPDSIEEAVK